MTLFAVLLITMRTYAQEGPDAIIGVWETEDKDGRMEFYKCGDAYCGKLLWGKDIVGTDGVTSKKDTNNPDEALRNRDLVGITNLTGLRYKNGEYADGEIYDANSGKMYSCKVKLRKGEMHMRGYIGVPLLGQTVIWKRVK
ncbi:signal peptidase (plasmid) [Fulvitalea axinellae]|uniref:Signal peptidase n=2 Tax=Fulvitalea axinellae TaxID=1182444 RepID=A0AAU9DP27_9BACT|nr:signal peptidase [Fulvitalea axinellae]